MITQVNLNRSNSRLAVYGHDFHSLTALTGVHGEGVITEVPDQGHFDRVWNALDTKNKGLVHSVPILYFSVIWSGRDQRLAGQSIIDLLITVIVSAIPSLSSIRIDSRIRVITILEVVESIFITIEVECRRVRAANRDLVPISHSITIRIRQFGIRRVVVEFLIIGQTVIITIHVEEVLISDIIAVIVLAI